jgi:hypothetical protein
MDLRNFYLRGVKIDQSEYYETKEMINRMLAIGVKCNPNLD